MPTDEWIDRAILTETGYVPESELRRLCRAIEAEVKAEAQELPAWRDHPTAIDSKALATAQEIALMWGQNRSQFVAHIQVAVTAAMVWMWESVQQPPAPCPYCDDTGDVHSPDGEWRGECSCGAEKYAQLQRENDALQAKVAEQAEEIERQNSAYEELDEQRNRDFETIAQQANRIAELIASCDQVGDDNERLASRTIAAEKKSAQQAALIELIEQCEKALAQFVDDWEQMNLPNPSVCQEALAAIAANRGQS